MGLKTPKITSVWKTIWRQWARLSMSCKNIWLLLLCKSEVVLRYLSSPVGSFSEEILVFPTSSYISTQKIAMENVATKDASIAQGPVNSRITDWVSTRRKNTYATSESQFCFCILLSICSKHSYISEEATAKEERHWRHMTDWKKKQWQGLFWFLC